jgi:hypothetical protein
MQMLCVRVLAFICRLQLLLLSITTCFLGSINNQSRHPVNKTSASTSTGKLKLFARSAIFPKEIDNKNPPICPKKFITPATVPALLPPISTQVEKEAMPLAEKKRCPMISAMATKVLFEMKHVTINEVLNPPNANMPKNLLLNNTPLFLTNQSLRSPTDRQRQFRLRTHKNWSFSSHVQKNVFPPEDKLASRL